MQRTNDHGRQGAGWLWRILCLPLALVRGGAGVLALLLLLVWQIIRFFLVWGAAILTVGGILSLMVMAGAPMSEWADGLVIAFGQVPDLNGRYNVGAWLTLPIILLVQVGRFLSWRQENGRQAAPSQTHGTAAFAGRSDIEVAGLLDERGLLLGQWIEPALRRWFRLFGTSPTVCSRLRFAGPSHLLTIAPTRAGKGVGGIIPNLLTYGGSVLCIDPKGENARITAAVRRDELGQAVFVLDPYGVSGCAGSAFDPLAAIDPFGADAVDDARLVADTLVYDPPDQRGEAHWNEEAKALIAGLVLHLLTVGRAGERDLSALRAALTGSPEEFRRLLATMAANPACDGVIARSAHRMMGKSDREFAGVVSSAQRHTHFLDGPRMRAVTGRSDFSLGDLKTGSSSPKGGSRPGRPITVYLVLPPERLATHGRWLRLMVAQALQTLARTPGRGGPSVLFLLDEFAALGRLEAVETAFGLMAGYGVRIWPFLQDLSQLRALYGEKAGTFLANAGVLQAFGVNDHATARLLSDMLGQSTVLQVTQSQGQSVTYGSLFSGVETTWSENSGTSTGPTGRPLLMPDEIRRMGADEQLLFVQGQPPVRARKIRWFEEPDMATLVNASPVEKHS